MIIYWIYMIAYLQELLPKTKIDCFGKGSLQNKVFPYYNYSLIMVLAIMYVERYPWLFLVYGYVLIPFIDEFVFLDKRNPDRRESEELEKMNLYYQLPVFLAVILGWILFIKIVGNLAQMEITIGGMLNLVGLILFMFGTEAGAFLTSHQIMHKQSFFNRTVGVLNMTKNLYIHFYKEHCFGHHRRVATPQDPATSKLNEKLYEFVVRSFLGSYKSVYQMEKQEGKPFLLNFAVLSVASALGFSFSMFLIFGLQGWFFATLIGIGSIFYLQVINYLEHYGLMRKKLENGEYEKVTIHHSWNSALRYSNYTLFKLQRHSDHHQNSLKPYQTLLTYDESPQLPHGYTLMLIMASYPKMWFAVMNPIIFEYQKHKNGSIKSEIMEKAHKLCRQFMIKNSLTIVGICLISLVM